MPETSHVIGISTGALLEPQPWLYAKALDFFLAEVCPRQEQLVSHYLLATEMRQYEKRLRGGEVAKRYEATLSRANMLGSLARNFGFVVEDPQDMLRRIDARMLMTTEQVAKPLLREPRIGEALQKNIALGHKIVAVAPDGILSSAVHHNLLRKTHLQESITGFVGNEVWQQSNPFVTLAKFGKDPAVTYYSESIGECQRAAPLVTRAVLVHACNADVIEAERFNTRVAPENRISYKLKLCGG